MKILIVHNFYQQPGGEDAVVRNELQLLQDAGEEVSLYAVHNDSIDSFGARLRTFLTVGYNAEAKNRLRARLRADRPDVVHVHNFFPLLSPAIFDACRAEGVPSVMTLHNFRTLCPTSFLYHDEEVRERSLHHSCWWTVPRRVYRNSLLGTFAVASMVERHKRAGTWLRSVDRFVALTHFAKGKFVEGGFPAGKILVKGNAAPDPGFSEAEMAGPRDGALFVGRLSEEKGIRTLVEAFAKVTVTLRIAGDGPLRGWVEANATPNVTLLGRQDREQIRREMLRAQFLVLPSVWYEMFPMVVPEAFACGLPVIVSRLAGLSEIVEDGATGRHFATADADDLANTVRAMTSQPEALHAMGRRARAAYEEGFTPELNYERLMRIYSDLAQGALGDDTSNAAGRVLDG